MSGYLMSISEARFGPDSVEQVVTIVKPGIGLTDCWECGGDGDWGKFHPEPEILDVETSKCVNCKGSGKRYVDAWALPKEPIP